MKKLILFICIIFCFGRVAASRLPASVVYIPDPNFKAYLVGNANINTNNDSEIQVSEAEAFTGTINCFNKNIADLTGIEAFVNIVTLLCYNNQLTSLDVSKNTALTTLYCHSNQLTALDVSKNVALQRLDCFQNLLASLDIGENTALTILQCYSNQLTGLDVTKNTALTYLYCFSNKLTSLNLKNGQNAKITTFNATNNPNLFCIQVDDPATAHNNWAKDATATYNTNCGTLPVSLLTFTAKADGNYTKLQWQTVWEQNNKGFEIYRRGGGLESFVKIGDVSATIDHQLSTINNIFTDKNPLNGSNYYKLVQIDNNGTATELGIRMVNFSLPTSDIRLFPNPTNDKITITFTTGKYHSASLLGVDGKILKTVALKSAQTEVVLDLSVYTPGVYFVKLTGKGVAETRKVGKVR